MKILITPKEACESLGRLPEGVLASAEMVPVYGRIDDADTLAGLLSDKDGAVLDLERITAAVLDRCPNLKVISRFGEGCDNIDLCAAKERRVKVARTEGVASRAVARHAIALIMALARNVTANDATLKKGEWARRPNLPESEMTIGVVGFGKIGKAVAEMARSLGFKVVVLSPGPIDSDYQRAAGLDELAHSADIISLHCPLTADTRGMISRDMIGRLAGKYLVNTARGALVDEEALFRALDSGIVAGYATDVFCEEPVRGASLRLAQHCRTVCSPHIAAMDKATAVNMTKRAVENALYCLAGDDEKVISYV